MVVCDRLRTLRKKRKLAQRDRKKLRLFAALSLQLLLATLAGGQTAATQKTRAQETEGKSLVGTWVTKGEKGTVTFVFSANGSLTMSGKSPTGAVQFSSTGNWSQQGDLVALSKPGELKPGHVRVEFLDASHAKFVEPGHETEAVVFERVGDATHPRQAEQHVKMGMEQYKKGNLEAAIAEYREAIKLNEANPKFHTALGDLLLKKRDMDGTLSEWSRAFQLQPTMSSAQHEVLGKFLLIHGDLDGSLREFSEAAKIAPNDVQLHEDLAAVYAKKRDLAGEINQYGEIQHLEPADVGNHERLGMALLKQNRYEEAKVQFSDAVRLAPKSAVAHAGLGAAEVGLGNFDEAAAQLGTARRIDPQNLLAQKQVRTLSQLQAQKQQQMDAAAAAARPVQSCDANWSPRFDSIPGGIDSAGMRAQIQQLNGYVTRYGGFDGAIRQVETDNATNQANNNLSADQAEALNLLSQGLIDILRCRQSLAQSASMPSSAGPNSSYAPGLGNSSSTGRVKTYTPGRSSDNCPLPGDGTGVTIAMAQGCEDSGGGSGARGTAGSSTHTYTPGSGSSSNDDSPGDYTPGAPTVDTSMGMLDTAGNLKQAFVGMSSDYSAVDEQNHSSCDATVHVVLLSSQPSGNGATLQFKASVQPNPSSPAVPTGCFELEYTIEATQRMTNGDPGPAAGQTFKTQFADVSDSANIELPIASTGSNGIDLVGWRVIGALCHTGGKCVKQLAPEQCAQLEDYKASELPNQMMDLIRKYKITTINRDAAAKLQADWSQSISDINVRIILEDLLVLNDEISDLAAIFSPEGELANLAGQVGPRPSATALDVWKLIIEPQAKLMDVRTTVKESVDKQYLFFAWSIAGRYFPVAKLAKDILERAKTVGDIKNFRDELGQKISDLQAAIDDYNNSLRSIMNQFNDIKQVSDGIDMACGGPSPNGQNP